ncbi:four helix bundle protein [Candidatus Parcubacteria bacterium]|nr:MAG: four helix bundle protein [Candidatus Parcubacteria bacterium]
MGVVKIQKSKFKMQNYNSKFKSDLKTRCYKFSLVIISLIDSLPNKRTAWIIADQLLRSAMSIGANLIEGSAASSRIEYKKFYEIALKSANEAKYWLAMLKELIPVKKEGIDAFIREADEISKIIGTSVLTMKGKRNL